MWLQYLWDDAVENIWINFIPTSSESLKRSIATWLNPDKWLT